MQNSFNDIWEAMLKTAVLENSYNKIKDYPPLEEINNLNSALNYNEEGTGTFILNALKIAL